MIVLRIALVLLLGTLAGGRVQSNDTSLLEGLFVQALSILSGVAIAAAFFFLENADTSATRTITFLESLRAASQQDPLGDLGKLDILNRFASAKRQTFLNGVCVLVLAGIFTAAVAWNRIDIPFFTWHTTLWLTKVQAIHSVCFCAFGLTLLCAYDILETAYTATRMGRVG